MTVAEVRLFIYGIDRANGDVPIFATAAAEDAAATGTGTVQPSLTFTQVKVRRDPYPQTIEVSISETSMNTLELCDVAVIRIGNINRWYWVTGYQEITNSAYTNGTANRMNVAISLEYIPVTTGLTLNSKIDIIPERTPSATPRVMQNWTQSIIKQSTPSVAFPSLPKIPKVKRGTVFYNTDTPVLWCEVIYTQNNIVHKLGMFISAYLYHYVGSISTNSECIAASQYMTPLSSEGVQIYPSLTNIINNANTYLNISGTITDINISEFCPYETVKGTSNFGVEEYLRLKNLSGNELTPTERYAASGYHYYAYEMDNWTLKVVGTASGVNDAYPKPAEGSISLSLSSFEQKNGNIILKDTMRNNVFSVPRELMASTLTFDYIVYSDLSNIYITLALGEFQTTLSGYKIPWATSMWSQYRAYNLQYDRQALQNNIDMANRDMEIGLMDSAVNGIIGGVIGGAITKGGATGAAVGAGTGLSSFIGGAITNNLRREQQIDKLQREQRLTEQRMKNGPATMNNTSYGNNVIDMFLKFGGSEFILQMPADFTETEFNNQTAIWGYPSNKVLQTNLVLTAGYWKGMIRKMTNTINNAHAGELSNMMVEQFDNGLRLKQVS